MMVGSSGVMLLPRRCTSSRMTVSASLRTAQSLHHSAHLVTPQQLALTLAYCCCASVAGDVACVNATTVCGGQACTMQQLWCQAPGRVAHMESPCGTGLDTTLHKSLTSRLRSACSTARSCLRATLSINDALFTHDAMTASARRSSGVGLPPASIPLSTKGCTCSSTPGTCDSSRSSAMMRSVRSATSRLCCTCTPHTRLFRQHYGRRCHRMHSCPPTNTCTTPETMLFLQARRQQSGVHFDQLTSASVPVAPTVCSMAGITSGHVSGKSQLAIAATATPSGVLTGAGACSSTCRMLLRIEVFSVSPMAGASLSRWAAASQCCFTCCLSRMAAS